MGAILEARREKSHAKLKELGKHLQDSSSLVEGKACVYSTGSYGRGEAGVHSDLDLFIAGGTAKGERGNVRRLSNLDEICLKANLIRATRKVAIMDFSGDGEYLKHYTGEELCTKLGTPEDDVLNTFTARLLLLLESRCLIGERVYAETMFKVIGAYWRDYDDHEEAFVPAYLANDILRLWRTFCVNYEARTQDDPPEKRAKRKLKNYKLKHSRLLTCYSALLHLAAVVVENHTVTPEDARRMTELTPTQRIENLPQLTKKASRRAVAPLLQQYETFLEQTDMPEGKLVQTFMKKRTSAQYLKEARAFGDSMHNLLQLVADGSPFYRMLLV